MKTIALLECALSAALLLNALACSDSESAEDASDSVGGTGGGAASSSTSSSTSSQSGSTSASSSGASTGGGGAGGGGGDCDLDAQDCAARGQSCYPTADGAICEPTGSGEPLDQCTKNSDCSEGLFCNPDNFMSCVPWCHLAADECMMGTTCFDNPNVDLPPGYGYCLPN